MPAIYDLANRGLLPPGFALTGFARRDWDAAGLRPGRLRRRQASTPAPRSGRTSGTASPRASASCRAASTTTTRSTGSSRPSQRPRPGPRHRRQPRVLPVDPAVAFPVVCKQLARSGLSAQDGDQWRRVVIEKPFGHDLKSAIELNEIVNDVFPEESVFRIDHYLGKETVQNILALRFANQLFEPIWNATTSTTCRSRWPRTSAWAGARATTTASARPATSSRTTCCSCWRSSRWRSPRRSPPAELRAEKIKVLNATRLVVPARGDHRPRPVHRRLAGRRAGAAA